MQLHLTPEGNEMVYRSDESAHEPITWWVDLVNVAPVQLEPEGELQAFYGWTDDERAVLWAKGLLPDGFTTASLLEFDGFGGMTPHAVDFQGKNPWQAWLHEGGDWLVWNEDDVGIWAAPVVDHQAGVSSPIAGEPVGEDPIMFITLDPDNPLAVLIRQREDLTLECELVEFSAGAIVEAWPVGPCTQVGALHMRNGHAYFSVVEPGPVRRVWHVDTQDPFAVGEPITAPFVANQPFGTVSPNGQWVFFRSGNFQNHQYEMSGLSQPGVNELLIFDGMTAPDLPRIIP